MFVGLLQPIQAQPAGFMRISLSLNPAGLARAQVATEEHGYSLDAIAAKDGDAAETAMRFPVCQARRRMIDRDRHS